MTPGSNARRRVELTLDLEDAIREEIADCDRAAMRLRFGSVEQIALDARAGGLRWVLWMAGAARQKGNNA